MTIFGRGNLCTSRTLGITSEDIRLDLVAKPIHRQDTGKKGLKQRFFGLSRYYALSQRKGQNIWLSLTLIRYLEYTWNSWSKKILSNFCFDVIFSRGFDLKNAPNYPKTAIFWKTALGLSFLYIISDQGIHVVKISGDLENFCRS